MAGTPTFGDLTTPADMRAFTVHLIDASGDTWTERLITALSATYAAVQAWVLLYQAITQASVWAVTEEHQWAGDADPDNATFLARSGVENGINLSFRNPDTNVQNPIRAVAPVAEVMQGNQDIPLLTGGSMDEFIIATIGLMPGFDFRQSQYTVHRERRNNPRVG